MKKLDNENIYRYLNLEQTADLLNALVTNGTYIKHPLVSKLLNVVTMQAAYYSNFPHLMAMIRNTKKILEEKGEKTLQITEAYHQIA